MSGVLALLLTYSQFIVIVLPPYHSGYLKATALACAPIIATDADSSSAANPLPAATTDDGHPRRFSIKASLHPTNLKDTAMTVVDAASASAFVAASVAGSWFSRRLSGECTCTLLYCQSNI